MIKPFDIEHELIYKPVHVKLSILLSQRFTYNILRNKYALSGLLYGVILSTVGWQISLDLSDIDDGYLKYLLTTLNYFLYLQPIFCYLILGAIGTMLKIKREYFIESYYALMEIADTDSLTSLYNNRYFKIRGRELFHLAKRHQEEFCIVMFDIDDFKKVNDTYGHPEGDHILYEVAAIIKRFSRSSDIPVRYGGEEFLIFLNKTSPKIGYIIADRIRDAVDKQVIVLSGKEPMNVTLSGGIAFFPDDAEQIEELIRIADTRLYEAKANGKNQVINGGKNA